MAPPLPLSVSRPKIHRPPFVGSRKSQKKPMLPGFLVFWGGVLLALIVLSLSIKKEPVIKEATTLPPVAVVSNRIAPPAEPAPVQSDSLIAGAIGDAQAAPSTGKPGTTIMLKDQSGAIVGQMARIPLENEQITEVKPINNVDNGGGRELLSIVGKY